MKTYDAFLAVSYRPACVDDSDYRRSIETFLKLAEAAKLSVYAAPHEENWGLTCPTRYDAVVSDHAALSSCRALVYFTGGFESDGALVELGMALAFRKCILIAHYAGEVLSSHVQGLVDIGFAEEIVLEKDADMGIIISRLSHLSSPQGFIHNEYRNNLLECNYVIKANPVKSQ